MYFKGSVIIISVTITIIFLTYIIYKKIFVPPIKKLYLVERPQKRTIHQEIRATGTLEIKDHIKVGSLISGTIKQIYVQENEIVNKGQLLVLIDNGKGDTDVKNAFGEVEYTQANLEYQKKYFNRQKQLFQYGQISKDSFEKITRDYKLQKARLKSKQALLQKAEIDFNNTKILAPVDGIIISIGITKGMRITTDLDATVLFVIAKDVTKMEAILDIDESDIGQIKKGQKVKFTVSAYLDRIFQGKISDVSYSPLFKNNILSYKAKVIVDDPEKLLRPGMTINANIKVSKCKDSYSISALAFQINKSVLEVISKTVNFSFKQIDKKRKKEIELNNQTPYSIKYVWVVDGKNFIEKPIKTHITNEQYFQIKNGISNNDNIIIDVEEPDEMDKLYKNIFKSAI
ncbi:efflux RND transporter periplasmic adaptor subunit [Candidatus Dependentiae bacterium]